MAEDLEVAVGLLKEVKTKFKWADLSEEESDLVERLEAFTEGKRSGMFTELLDVIFDRTVVITIAQEGEKRLRVNVIPKKKKKGKDGDEGDYDDSDLDVLTQPFTVVGSAAELDAELPALLTQFVAERKKAADSIGQFKTAADAARKRIEEETKKLDAEAAKKNAAAKTKVAEAAKKIGEKPKPETGGLFGGDSADEEGDKD